MNYFAEFISLDNIHYKVYIEPDSGDSYTEINLAANSPFVVTYNEQDTLYDSIRTSTAQINIVYNEYLFDAFKEIATGTKVRLVSILDNTESPKWLGYLQNNLENASYENCIETISLQASDCLAKAQYIPYETVNGAKNIVNFKDIINRFILKTGYNFNVLLPTTRRKSSEPIRLEKIDISEFNFFTSDTDKAWNYQEVLSEFAKYFGFTLIQWGKDLIFLDLEGFTRSETVLYSQYVLFEDTLTYYMTVNRGGKKVFTADDFTAGGGQLSFKTIYNKIKVNCNYYDIDVVIPDIFNDEYLSYIYGDKSEVRLIPEVNYQPAYFTGDYATNKESVDKYYHYRRELKNSNYIEHWYNMNEIPMTANEIDNFTDFAVIDYGENSSSNPSYKQGWRWQCFWTTMGYDDIPGTHTEIGSYQDWSNADNSYTFTAEFNGRYLWQRMWYADFNLYLNGRTFAAVNDNYWHPYYLNDGDIEPLFFYCIDPFNGAVGFIPFTNNWRLTYTYPSYSYEAPDYMPQIYYDQFLWVDETMITSAWVSFMVDNSRSDRDRQFTANFWYSRDPVYTGSTTFWVPAHQQVNNSVSVSTYLENGSNYWTLQVISEDGTSGVTSWTKPLGLDPTYPQHHTFEKDCIGARIIDLADINKGEQQASNKLSFTRYLMLACQGSPSGETLGSTDLSKHLPLYELNTEISPAVFVAPKAYFFINCNAIFERYWNIDYINSEWATDESKIYQNDGGIKNQKPALVFCFGVGGKYWNGASWQNTECNFKVEMFREINSDNPTPLWNTALPIKNQIGWEQWSSGEGYKIPFNDSLNLSGKIVFKICTPVKMQNWGANNSSSFNGYCWLKDLTLGLATRGDEKAANTDVVYENIISEDSLNELNEIDLKLTTYPNLGRMGYSHMAYNGKLLSGIRDTSLNGEIQVPEESIVERYVRQYSTPTRKETLTLGMDIAPFNLVHDDYWNADFAVIGQTINYAMGQNEINTEEIKKNTTHMDGTIIYYTANTETSDWELEGWGANVIAHGDGYITFDVPPTSVPTGAFVNNSGLTRLELPYSILSIGNAISGNTNLAIIKCDAEIEPTLSNNGLESNKNSGVVVTPSGSDYSNWYTRLGWTYPTGSLTVPVTAATVYSSNGSITFDYVYTGEKPLSLSPSASYAWVQSKIENNAVVLTYENNNTASARTASFVLSSGSESKTISLTQSSGIISLTCEQSSVAVSSDGETIKPAIVIKYNGVFSSITVSSDQSWVSGSEPNDWEETSDGSGMWQAEIPYECSYSTSGRSRVAILTITDGNLSQTVKVMQDNALVIKNPKVYYGSDDSGWFEAPSYQGLETDFILPDSGYTQVMIRYQLEPYIGATGSVPLMFSFSMMDGYKEGYYYENVPLGFIYYNYDAFATDWWYFRINNQMLKQSRYNANSGSLSLSAKREAFEADKLFQNLTIRNNTVFGDGYQVNAFEVSSIYGNHIIKENGTDPIFRIYRKA